MLLFLASCHIHGNQAAKSLVLFTSPKYNGREERKERQALPNHKDPLEEVMCETWVPEPQKMLLLKEHQFASV